MLAVQFTLEFQRMIKEFPGLEIYPECSPSETFHQTSDYLIWRNLDQVTTVFMHIYYYTRLCLKYLVRGSF